MISYFLLEIIFICALVFYLYYFQLKAYFKFRYLKFIIFYKTTIFQFFIFLIDIILNFSLFKIHTLKINYHNKINIIFLIKTLIILILIFVHYLIKINKNKKIKFNFTFRITRNIAISCIFSAFYIILFKNYYFIYFPHIFILFSDFLDFYRYFQNLYYKLKAKKVIKNNKIIKIGITGSNGKTSVKNILYELLKNSYNVAITPKNFNTPKGIIYTITKKFDSNTNLAIFEMGARKRKDILTLSKIARPDFGILLNISCQHLETFKSIKNVYKTKTELPKFLKTNLCVYTYNNPLSFKAYLEKEGEKILVGIIENHKKIIKKYRKINLNKKLKDVRFFIKNKYKLDLIASNIKIKNNLYSFRLTHKNIKTNISSPLLGKHNILNILSATALALKLGVDIKDIKNTIKNLSPIEHRLQLIKGRINILDDSYNCSLESAKNSLEVLSLFPNRRCVCTPGIIEGGRFQNEINLKLSKLIEHCSDFQIFVGKTNRHTFMSVFKNKKSAYFVDTLDEAKYLFESLLKTNDTLLLLNDLPDDYS